MYESEDVYYGDTFVDDGGGEGMEVETEQAPVYYQESQKADISSPGPSSSQPQMTPQQLEDSKKPRIKRDYTEQKKQTVRLRKALDEGTLQRMTKSMHPPRPGQLGMVLRRVKKTAEVLQQLPEEAQDGEVGSTGLRDDQQEKLDYLRDAPDSLHTLLSGLRIEAPEDIYPTDFDERDPMPHRVVYEKFDRFRVRPPGFDLKNIQGATAESIRADKAYQKVEEGAKVRLMLRQVQLDIKLCQFLKSRLRPPSFLRKTRFAKPEDGCTETCARIRPAIKIFPNPAALQGMYGAFATVEHDADAKLLIKNQATVDRYTLDNEMSSEVLGAYEMHRRAIAHPALNKITMNLRTLGRQRKGLEKEKPRMSMSNKISKKDKFSKMEEPQTPIEPMKMVIKRIQPQMPGKKKIPTSSLTSPSSNRYQISQKIQHPPAQAIIPKKKARKAGPRNQYKDWD